MLKAYSLATQVGGYCWSISPLTGSLLRHSSQPKKKLHIPKAVCSGLDICNEPYKCAWGPISSHAKLDASHDIVIRKYNNVLHAIGSKFFLLSRFYAGLSDNIFEDTRQAFGFIAKLPEQISGRENNCLQRTLLAAKTSNSFKKEGVIFIGAQIAASTMHSWIIENGAQPDHQDRIWINYRPLLALTFQ
jgi:hypothetical protein